MTAQRKILFILLIFMANGSQAGRNTLKVSMRKMYVVSVETQESIVLADQIYASFARILSSATRYSLVPVDSIQAHFHAVFLANFTVKYDAVDLLDFAQSSGLDIVLFFYLQRIKGGHNLYVKAVEFPSDIFVSDLVINLSLPDIDLSEVMQKLQSFVDMIWLNMRDMGYGFHSSEKGVLFFTDDLHSPALRRTLKGVAAAQSFLYDYDVHDLKIKVSELGAQDWPVTPARADSFLTHLHAQALFLFPRQGDSQLYFPAQTGKASIMDNSLPLWLPYDGFHLFSWPFDSAYGHALGQSLLPQTYGAINELVSQWQGRSDAAKSLLLKNIQTLQQAPGHLLTDNHRALSLLYESLAHTFSPDDKEFGWIKLNQASHLKERGELVASLDASRAAFDNFQKGMNLFGLLFSLLQNGDTLEKLRRPQEAATIYKEALDYCRQLHDVHTLALIYYRLGSIEFSENRLIEAWDFFDNSADSYLQIGDTLKVVQLATKLGILMRQSNFLKKSTDYLQQAAALAQYLDDDRESADAGYHLAVTLKELDEKQKALDHFQTAGDLMEMLADTVGLANTEEHTGDIFFELEQWKSAQQSFEYAARFYKYIPDIEGVIRSVTKAADTAAARKRWLRAQNDYDEALKYANLYKKAEWVSIIIYKKGMAHIRAGEYALGQQELELARQGDVAPEAIDLFMKSFIRDLEEELEKGRP
ncbi:hypothetical protein JW998_17675 [candidate division KSB1 bacterium]|nr:hypothetical protein [candidate division KSB1 bacterium]